jgi:hypothetical protein
VPFFCPHSGAENHVSVVFLGLVGSCFGPPTGPAMAFSTASLLAGKRSPLGVTRRAERGSPREHSFDKELSPAPTVPPKQQQEHEKTRTVTPTATPVALEATDERPSSLTESLFGKIHAFLASRLNIRRIVATLMKVSLVCTIRS